ncbi:MAG: hypothetical protein JEY96_12520 [Bacteroidales bacterium]|jgi:hypothetical protein|nr:hypothetical protein [Bacteroidales bacterium]
MNKTFPKILSILLHPLLFPSIGILILFNSGSILEFLPFEAKKIILLIVALSTIILPLTFVPFYIYQKIIKNVQMDHSKERLIPFFVTFVLYTFCYYLLMRLGAPQTIANFILVGAVSVLVLFGVSFKWKISAHMVGIGGLTGALIAISFILYVNLDYFIMATIGLSGLLGYSRLKLDKHEPYQIYLGWIIGIFISLFILLLF